MQRLRHAPLPYASPALGPYQGKIVDEPGTRAGQALGHWPDRPGGYLLVEYQIDRAGVDVNEFGWLIGWVMECMEKVYITKEQLGGLEVRWGDAEAANQLLQLIAQRQHLGDLLAEGQAGVRAPGRAGGRLCHLHDEGLNATRP